MAKKKKKEGKAKNKLRGKLKDLFDRSIGVVAPKEINKIINRKGEQNVQ